MLPCALIYRKLEGIGFGMLGFEVLNFGAKKPPCLHSQITISRSPAK